MNNKAMFSLSYGLFVLTAVDGEGNPSGCITNTAIQAAVNPDTIVFAVNKANYTHDLVMENKKCNISVLSEDADFELFKHFGFQSGRDVSKFSGFNDYKMGTNGVPIITRGTNAYLSLWVTDTVDLGSHTLFIAKIADMDVLSDVPSATYAYYHAHIKPQPESKGAEGKTFWRCTICGYIYDGDPIPEDFICPVCKHPASDFEKVTQ